MGTSLPSDDDDFESLIATPRELDRALGQNTEAVERALDAALADDEEAEWKRAAWLARLNASRELLLKEADEQGDDVFVAPSDPLASLLQSYTIEYGEATGRASPLPTGGLEVKFEDGIRGRDVHWVKSVIEKARSSLFQGAHAVVRPLTDQVGVIPNSCRIALLSDWGTGLYGAPKCRDGIEGDPVGYQMVMHLGDVYYSGTEKEMLRRFLKSWPRPKGAVSRALNGNHEMYSGGHAYFELVLPEFQQESSYFAVQNDEWVLVALDTAHLGHGNDHDLDAEQLRWLGQLVGATEPRRMILFSHHQPYSILSGQGPKLVAKLELLIASDRLFAWYWGHEHRCVLYQANARFGFLGRCIGHSGIPYRRDDVKNAPIEEARNGAEWRRIWSDDPVIPSGLILDGPNPDVKGKVNQYGPNGYLTLMLDGKAVYEMVHLPDGTVVRESQLA
jgi:hypothetical protein